VIANACYLVCTRIGLIKEPLSLPITEPSRGGHTLGTTPFPNSQEAQRRRELANKALDKRLSQLAAQKQLEITVVGKDNGKKEHKDDKEGNKPNKEETKN
jgi:hypothetical protein